MIRRIVPLLAVAALAACSSSTSNTNGTLEPGATSTARTAESGGAGDGRGVGGRRGGPGGAGQREDMVMRGITLSTDQQQRIEAIRASYRTRMEEARQAAGTDRAAMRERMQPLMEKQQAEIRAVLTTEQQAQFDRNVAEMRERMQQGGGRRPNG
jgi:periplasmic protein CpxP/Spy